MDSSAELLDRARGGDAEALGLLAERHAGRLLGWIRLRLGRSLRSRLESRDILQTTLLKAIGGIADVRAEESRSFGAWLARIAEHQIRDEAAALSREKRDAARTVPLEAGDDPPIAHLADRVRSVTSRLVLAEQAEALERALDELPPDQREVVLLRRFEELDWAEVGRRMERSPDACRMLHARALAALALRMGAAR